jgi:hypothetical protein
LSRIEDGSSGKCNDSASIAVEAVVVGNVAAARTGLVVGCTVAIAAAAVDGSLAEEGKEWGLATGREVEA